MSTQEQKPNNAEETQPDGGPTFSIAGVQPLGPQTGWKTANPNPDATRPETMPKTISTAMPGESDHDEKSTAAQPDPTGTGE